MCYLLRKILILSFFLCSFLFSSGQNFVAIGDFGVNDSNELAVSQLVKSLNPEFIISTGDNNYPKGEQSTIDGAIGKYYQEYIHPYTGIYGPGADSNMFWPSPGNHDYDTPGAIPYYNYFQLPGNERYYDFVKGDVHFFSLNSNIEEPDGIDSASTQALWLKNGLAQSTSKWKIVYFHHAPYGSVGHGSAPVHQWPYEAWGADVVITGHNHIYERLHVDGFPYFIVGTGGRKLHTIYHTILQSTSIHREFGALHIQASPDSLRFEYHGVDNGILDTYTIGNGNLNTDQIVIKEIHSGLDDVEENEFNGSIYTHSSDLELGHDNLGNQGCQVVGLRYNDVQIPKNVIIKRAFIQVISDAAGSGPHMVEITGGLVGNAAPFDTTEAFHLTNFPKTSNAVSWSLPDFQGSKEGHQSPDIAHLIQEIIDQPDWGINNSLALFIAHINGSREVESYEGRPGSAPQLFVEYEVPVSVSVAESMISHGSQDVEESGTTGILYSNSTDIELGYDSFNGQNYQTSGLRFQNLNVPSGAIITQAYVEWTVDAVRSNPCQLEIWAEASGNALPFNTSQNYNLSNRPKTSVITWAPPVWSPIGAKVQSTDLSPLVQEVIDQATWDANNPLHIYVKGTQGTRETESFEGDPSGAARLVVFYSSSNPQKEVFASLGSGSNDVEESETSGSVYTSSSDIELGFDGYNQQNYQTVGLRFENLFIPQGAYIQSAHLDFTVDHATGSISKIDIDGELSPNSLPFDDFNFYEVSSRQRTQNQVHWQPSAWYPVGGIQSSPDLSLLVQEIVDQNGWSPGNALSFIIKGSQGTREADSYEAGAHLGARLRIIYSDVNPNRTLTTYAPLEPQASPLDGSVLFPNPGTGSGMVNIRLTQPIEGDWHFEVYNNLGQLIDAQIISLDDGIQLITTEMKDIPTGAYELVLYNHEHRKTFTYIQP